MASSTCRTNRSWSSTHGATRRGSQPSALTTCSTGSGASCTSGVGELRARGRRLGTDEKSNTATRLQGVYAVGDPLLANGEAGVFAEAAARVVADDIAARLRGACSNSPEARERCIEFGGGMVGRGRLRRASAGSAGRALGEAGPDKVAFASTRPESVGSSR